MCGPRPWARWDVSGYHHRRMSAAAAVACQTLEVRAQLGGGLVPQVAVLLQRFVDDALQLRRHCGIETDGSDRRSVQDRSENDAGGFTPERQRASGHFIQHSAERE